MKNKNIKISKPPKKYNSPRLKICLMDEAGHYPVYWGKDWKEDWKI